MSNREKFSCRSSRAYGMNETSSPLRATNATGVFSRVDFSTDPNAQWPLESVVALWMGMPFLPKRSTTTFGSGSPSLIDIKKTSWVAVSAFLRQDPDVGDKNEARMVHRSDGFL